MTPPLESHPLPLCDDGRGGFRIGDSRVSLDTLLHEYQHGEDPESIVHHYPTLELADVYAVLAYYLRHQDEVNAYLSKRQAEAAALRAEIESQQPGRGELRAKLLARRAKQE